VAINIKELLGKEASDLLEHVCNTIPKDDLNLPGPDFVERVFGLSDRPKDVQNNLKKMFDHGQLKATGYLSILPGNAVASTLGVLGMVSKKYAHKISFIVKINHNELLSYPNSYDQRMFASVEQARNMGAAGVGATVYFGSEESRRQIEEVSKSFQTAHEMGLFTVLWCYLRNSAFQKEGIDYHSSADLTGQANYLGATIEADIIKQKQATNNGGFLALGFGKTHPLMYKKLTTAHPIDLTRYQVANCFMGRVGLINSGGASGEDDFKEAVRTAVINKRAGGMGLILGRKAFQKPMEDGIKIINAVQDVYLSQEVTVA